MGLRACPLEQEPGGGHERAQSPAGSADELTRSPGHRFEDKECQVLGDGTGFGRFFHLLTGSFRELKFIILVKSNLLIFNL